MTDTFIELSEDEFDAQHTLRTNHLNPDAGWAKGESAGCLFETYGQELAFVRSQDPRAVWTLLDGDDGDQYLRSGLHLVNRIGYLVSTVPVPEGTAIQVRIPMQSEQEAEAAAHTPEPWSYNGMAIVEDERGAVLADCEIIPPAGGTIAPPDEEVANARRICAAVNACKDISTEALERGIIAELLAALQEVTPLLDACARNAERLGQREFAAQLLTVMSANRAAFAAARPPKSVN